MPQYANPASFAITGWSRVGNNWTNGAHSIALTVDNSGANWSKWTFVLTAGAGGWSGDIAMNTDWIDSATIIAPAIGGTADQTLDPVNGGYYVPLSGGFQSFANYKYPGTIFSPIGSHMNTGTGKHFTGIWWWDTNEQGHILHYASGGSLYLTNTLTIAVAAGSTFTWTLELRVDTSLENLCVHYRDSYLRPWLTAHNLPETYCRMPGWCTEGTWSDDTLNVETIVVRNRAKGLYNYMQWPPSATANPYYDPYFYINHPDVFSHFAAAANMVAYIGVTINPFTSSESGPLKAPDGTYEATMRDIYVANKINAAYWDTMGGVSPANTPLWTAQDVLDFNLNWVQNGIHIFGEGPSDRFMMVSGGGLFLFQLQPTLSPILPQYICPNATGLYHPEMTDPATWLTHCLANGLTPNFWDNPPWDAGYVRLLPDIPNVKTSVVPNTGNGNGI